MDDEELRELQDPNTWEVEDSVHPPVPNPHAVVSVPFSSKDVQKVARCAERHGLRVIEFIRQAALDRAGLEDEAVPVEAVGARLGGDDRRR